MEALSPLAVGLAPLALLAALGMLLGRTGFLDRAQGAALLKLVIGVTLPALIEASLGRAPLAPDRLRLPLIAALVSLGCMAGAGLFVRLRRPDRATGGAIVLCAMILNNLVMFPLILARFGRPAFVDAVLFDCGNALMVATAAQLVAWRHAPGGVPRQGLRIAPLLRSPLLGSVAVGLALNALALPLPAALWAAVEALGALTTPLTLIALGVLFRPRAAHAALLAPVLLIRMGGGLGLGVALAALLGLRGQTFVVAALCAGAPVGFVSLSLSSVAGLDAEFAASAVSTSLAAGVVLVPVGILLLEHLA